MAELARKPMITRPLAAFMGTMILANIAGSMYRPLLPLYLQHLGASIAEIGVFFTLGAIAPLVFQILGGWLSDRVGRLNAIAIGSIAGVLGWIVYILAPSWQWLLISSITGAITASFIAPSFQAFIAEQSSEESRGRVYGITEAMFMIVGVVGPPLGGYLSQYLGFRQMFMVGGALYVIATIIRVSMARKTSKSAAGKVKPPSFSGLAADLRAMIALVLGGGVLTWIMISDGVRDITFHMSQQLQPVYMQNVIGITNVEIGWLAAAHAATAMALTMPGGWFSDRYSERTGIAMGFGCIALAIWVFLMSRGFSGLLATSVLIGVGSAFIGPAYNSLISKVVPIHLRGTAFGLFATSLGIISLPSPFIGALLWRSISPKAPFVAAVIGTIAIIPIIWVKFRLPKCAAPSAQGSVDVR